MWYLEIVSSSHADDLVHVALQGEKVMINALCRVHSMGFLDFLNQFDALQSSEKAQVIDVQVSMQYQSLMKEALV